MSIINNLLNSRVTYLLNNDPLFRSLWEEIIGYNLLVVLESLNISLVINFNLFGISYDKLSVLEPLTPDLKMTIPKNKLLFLIKAIHEKKTYPTDWQRAHYFTLDGNNKMARVLNSLFIEYFPSFDDLLSFVIGDIPTHFFSKAFNIFIDRFYKVNQHMINNTKTYLCNENNLLPSTNQINLFLDELQLTRNKVEQLERRYLKLKAMLGE